MIISFMILGGFQKVIADKVFNFTGHYQIHQFSLSNDFEEAPISTDSEFYTLYPQFDFIRHVQGYATKPGLLKGEDEVQGVIMKGIGPEFDSLTVLPMLNQGRFIRFTETGASNRSEERRLGKECS